jgi:hypothetical protein
MPWYLTDLQTPSTCMPSAEEDSHDSHVYAVQGQGWSQHREVMWLGFVVDAVLERRRRLTMTFYPSAPHTDYDTLYREASEKQRHWKRSIVAWDNDKSTG